MTDVVTDAPESPEVANIYNRTTSRVELSDGSMLGVEDERENFVITDYERGLEESGSIWIVAPDEPQPPKRAGRKKTTATGGDGQ